MVEKPKDRRKSRVLDYFEQATPKETESGGENPFQDIDSAFGLDQFSPEGDK